MRNLANVTKALAILAVFSATACEAPEQETKQDEADVHVRSAPHGQAALHARLVQAREHRNEILGAGRRLVRHVCAEQWPEDADGGDRAHGRDPVDGTDG